MSIPLHGLLAGEVEYLLVGCNHFPKQAVLLPGSFNPIHIGHRGLLSAAVEATGRSGLFELSLENVDKPALNVEEVQRRLQCMDNCAVVLTRAPTFLEKARLFPGAWFALGYDTAIRLLSPAYHEDLPAMLAQFKALGTRFVVAGRLYNGEFQGLESMNIPNGCADLFIPIPERIFREDISSSQLRKRQ